MKKHSKKLISILLAAAMLTSVFTASIISTSALGEYTPSDDIETNRYYFAMPGAWANDMTRAQNNTCGAYWWTGSDAPDYVPEANGHGWPGYMMNRDPSVENLRYIDVSKETVSINFNNFIDGGKDESTTEYAAAKQTPNTNLEGDWMEFDQNPFLEDFWLYVYWTYKDNIIADKNFQITEFGDYAGNISYNEEYEDFVLSYDNMIYVIDMTNDGNTFGHFYFYYGNGEYGRWPTKELLTASDYVVFDENGELDPEDELFDENGNIYRTFKGENYVVYGKIDEGKYIEGYYGDEDPTQESTEPITDPDVPGYIYGDINLDGFVTVADATLAQKNAAELIEFSDLEAALADCNSDSIVSVADATLIQKNAAEFSEDLILTGLPYIPNDGYLWPCPGYYLLTDTFSNHGAIDITGEGIMGAPVVAASDGTVAYDNNSCTHNWGKTSSCGCGGGYGNYVWLDHGSGKASIYGHLTSTAVSSGDKVKKGQVIGYVGSTGYSTGPHLHFECRQDGFKYNPMTEF